MTREMCFVCNYLFKYKRGPKRKIEEYKLKTNANKPEEGIFNAKFLFTHKER